MNFVLHISRKSIKTEGRTREYLGYDQEIVRSGGYNLMIV